MTGLPTNSDLAEDFAEVIELLEKNLKYLDSLGLDLAALRGYRKVISFLKARSTREVETILGARNSAKKPLRQKEPQLTDAEIERLTNDEIRSLLNSPDVARNVLERIASLRFAVTRGALSSLRTREALRDKLARLLSNEETHGAIVRVVASGESSGNTTTDE